MKFLVRFSQSHESFRLAELRALAHLHNIDLQVLDYRDESPFCIIDLPTLSSALLVTRRAILIKSISELWGSAPTYDLLHAQLKTATAHRWPSFMTCSFRFVVDAFQGSRTQAEHTALVDSFSYMGFAGAIRLRGADETFCVCEEWDVRGPGPKRVWLGRWVGDGGRGDVGRYSLKKRRYISTTSMDAELALVGSNLTGAAPGRLFYDPFVGTASLTIACSHHGAVTLGSDMDGRAIRGKKGNNVRTSYAQYGLQGRFLGGFVSDLTNSPLRIHGSSEHRPLFDGIVCDPPYGVREGLRVLGSATDKEKVVKYRSDGTIAHLADDYIPPKRPYSFVAMLADILDFAAKTLVVGGRVSLWMPVANDEDVELGIPMHAALELVSNCIQPFNRWSRRLLTYQRRKPEDIVEESASKLDARAAGSGHTADELNSFRRRYFQGFKSAQELEAEKTAQTDGAP